MNKLYKTAYIPQDANENPDLLSLMKKSQDMKQLKMKF